MASRLDAPDTDADRQIREVLDLPHLTGFTVVAGAGSGKTTSLVKSLAHITSSRGSTLLAKTQRVACITYTEVAAQEIHADLGNDPLAYVSTIHSFLWSLVKSFHRDIGKWVANRVEAEIVTLEAKQASYPSGTRETTKQRDAADLQRRQQQRSAVPKVSHWTYSVGSDYTQGVLGHSDVLKMVPELIQSKPLLARLVARQYPFVFVDESQDTFPDVVQCLKHVWSSANGSMCVGFFGDPMQQIYTQGVGVISLETGWRKIDKPQNFRSSARVLACVNAVRAEGDGSVAQVAGHPDTQPEGKASCFVLPSDERRSENLQRVRDWLDQRSRTGAWTGAVGDGGAKVLMIVHRMAARRMGFDGLYGAFNDHGSASLSETFTDGTAWPLTPFRDVILPLCLADTSSSPVVLHTLKHHGPRIRAAGSSRDLRAALAAARSAVEELRSLAGAPGMTLGELLNFAVTQDLFEPDPRISAYLQPDGEHRNVVIEERVRKVLDAMTLCTVDELDGYYTYVNQESPYSTQHGSKGAEFDRVVVVLDDDEGRFTQYSYDKLFGLKPLSATDMQNQAEGRDSAIERTRRLFYVCISRAKDSLAIVLFASDPERAADAVRESAIGAHVDIVTSDDVV